MGMTFGGKTCYDPAMALAECQRHKLPVESFLGKANAFTCPLGMKPGQGWLLLRRSDLDTLDLNAAHELTIFERANYVTLRGLLFAQCTCVLPAQDNHPNNLYLAEITDRRAVAPWLSADRAYNLRSSPGGDFAALTTNGGTAWTWDGMVGDLWGLASSFLGTYPGLPFTPGGTPEGWAFWGASLWDALGSVLARLACALRLDPTTDTFSLVRIGATDDALATMERRWSQTRLWDEVAIEPAVTRLPEKVAVLFLRQPEPAMGISPYYILEVPDTSPSSGTVAGTRVRLLDDMAALGATGVPTNAVALAARAAERAADWYRAAKSGYARRHRAYGSAVADPGVVPGARLGASRWGDRGVRVETEVFTARPPEDPLATWRPRPPGGWIEIDVVTEVCPIFETSGSGSGPGSGSGGITRTPLGAQSSGTAVTGMTIPSITVEAGRLLLLVTAIRDGTEALTATFDGNAMTVDRTATIPSDNPLAGRVSILSLVVGSTTTGNVVVSVSGGASRVLYAYAIEIGGLPTNSLVAGADASGNSSPPSVSLSTAYSDRYFEAVFLRGQSGSAVNYPATWSTPFYIGGAGDLYDVSDPSIGLTEGYSIANGSSLTASLAGETPTGWVGLVVEYH